MLEFALYFLQLSKFQENKFLFFFIFGPLAEKGYILIQKSTIEFFSSRSRTNGGNMFTC